MSCSKFETLGTEEEKDIEECLICYNHMKDKATIHCGHSFRFKFLKRSAEASNPTVLCLLCKTQYQVIWNQNGQAKNMVQLNILEEPEKPRRAPEV